MDKVGRSKTRVDRSHRASRADGRLPDTPRAPLPQDIAAAAGLAGPDVLTQVQTQAEQLAEQLSSRQQDLDQQEARVKARGMELENEQQAFRLWASQREQALDERERSVQQQLQELAAKLPSPPAVTADSPQSLDAWLRRRRAVVDRADRGQVAVERAARSPRWQSGELQQQWSKHRQEFVRLLQETLEPQIGHGSAAPNEPSVCVLRGDSSAA